MRTIVNILMQLLGDLLRLAGAVVVGLLRVPFLLARVLGRGLRNARGRVVLVYVLVLAVLAIALIATWTGTSGLRRHSTPPPTVPPPPGCVWVEVLTTGYCPCAKCCPGTADGRTAINRDVVKHPFGIAVEPRLITYGTHLFVPGYGEYMVDDTGKAMRDDAAIGIVHLDLRFKDHGTARRWGRQWLWVAMPQDCAAGRRFGLRIEPTR